MPRRGINSTRGETILSILWDLALGVILEEPFGKHAYRRQAPPTRNLLLSGLIWILRYTQSL